MLLLDSRTVTIPELLAAEMGRRRLSQRSLALFIGLSPSALNRYSRGTGTPDPAQCRQIAYRLGLSEEDVLRAAGHLSPPSEPPEMPAWLQGLLPTLAKLDEFEARTLEATAQTLLELREVRGAPEASPAAEPGPPPSPSAP